jgi:hypothetical protein
MLVGGIIPRTKVWVRRGCRVARGGQANDEPGWNMGLEEITRPRRAPDAAGQRDAAPVRARGSGDR